MDDADKHLEYIGKYNEHADRMANLWQCMPCVVDDDFPMAKHDFESAVRAFYEHALKRE